MGQLGDLSPQGSIAVSPVFLYIAPDRGAYRPGADPGSTGRGDCRVDLDQPASDWAHTAAEVTPPGGREGPLCCAQACIQTEKMAGRSLCGPWFSRMDLTFSSWECSCSFSRTSSGAPFRSLPSRCQCFRLSKRYVQFLRGMNSHAD